jgi:hypothetical protein
MQGSDSSSKETRPSPSPLQLRLDPNYQDSQPQPSPRAQSIESQTSLEEIEALDIPGQISRSISPVVNYVEYDFPDIPMVKSTPETENAAKIIQKWIKNVQRIIKTLELMKKAEFLTSISRLFGPLKHEEEGTAAADAADAQSKTTLLDKLSSCNGNEAISLTNSSIVAKDVAQLLMGMPRDATLRKLSVNLHGPRAFLSALLVMTHPATIFGEDNEDISIEGLFLKNASSMLMTNFQLLSKILLEFDLKKNQNNNIGYLKKFRKQLIMVRFARRYHAKAFGEFKKADAERVSNQLLGPYAELIVADYHATKSKNETLSNAAKSRIKQIRESIIQLIGPTAGEAKLQEVEAAVKQQFIDSMEEAPLPLQETTSGTDSDSGAAEESGGSSGGAAPSIDLNELESSLMNEQIAHELILDAKYQLPPLPEPLPFTPPTSFKTTNDDEPIGAAAEGRGGGMTPAQVEAKIAATMQDVFWQNLIRSLTPVKETTREDFTLGKIVQARYGGINGKFYEAKIIKIHNENGLYDIRYLQDNVEEYSIPFSQFRTSKDKIDPKPLISLLNEIIKRFEKATPNRIDLHQKYHEILDIELLTQMLNNNALDNNHMLKIVHFFLDTLSNLEAPIRSVRTMKWKNDFNEYISNLSSSSSTSDNNEDNISPFLKILPSLFTFLHTALNQLQRDTVNVHLSIIANKFHQNHEEEGMLYERKQFENKLNKNITTLQKTNNWLSSTMQAYCELPQSIPSSTSITSSTSSSSDSYSNKKSILSSRNAPLHGLLLKDFIEYSILDLLLKPIKWDSNEAIPHIPETLILDASRLSFTRDLYDQIILISTLIVLTRQVLSKYKKQFSLIQLTKLQNDLLFLLKSPSTRLPHLQDIILRAADEACKTSSTSTSASMNEGLYEGLSESDKTYLKGLINNAASPENAIFKLFSKRMNHLLKVMISYDHHHHNKSTNKTFEEVLDDEIKSTGLNSFKNEVLELTYKLNRFVKHNYLVFSSYYSSICESIASSLPPPPNPPSA